MLEGVVDWVQPSYVVLEHMNLILILINFIIVVAYVPLCLSSYNILLHSFDVQVFIHVFDNVLHVLIH